MHTLRDSFVLSFLALATSAATAQEWYLEQPGSAPAPRRFHTLAHLGGNNVLFGGVDEQSGVVHGDTWAWDGLAWTQLANGGPGPRQRFAACVDTTRKRLVVFGGVDGGGQVRGDTWEFDGSSWLPVLTTSAPSPRLGAAMAFDPVRNVAVLFGGGATAGTPDRETWEFDGTGWTLRTSAHAPTPRQGHAMTFDTTRNTALLFGGFASGATGFDNQTWQWNGVDWQQVVTPTVPPAVAFPALAFFEPHGVAVLTGSTGSAAQPLGTWVFDGLDWSTGPSSPTGFGGRQGHALGYDRAREMMVLFGGARIAIGGAVPLAETWELSVRATFAPFGTGCAFSGGTPVLGATTRPQLGSALQLEVAPAGALALFVAGTSDTTYLGAALPVELSALGLPGCELFTSVDVATFATPVGGVARHALRIPLQRTLLGAQVFVQALVTMPGAARPAALSNAGRATIGN